MARIVLVLLVLFVAIESPTAVLRCRLLVQEDHVTDPCLYDGSVHAPGTHSSHTTPSPVVDTTYPGIYSATSLLGAAGFALIYTIKSITVQPLTPPPRYA
ncbi:MAG: hypothetical protein CL608_25990 [Anaerolineaceae bacterium]|nr:hypothetical protein [Anaerolineaceae bacterium]